jgi:hypothetical protein
MMLGVLRASGDLESSAPPNKAVVINPDPWGSGGASLVARPGFGDGALEDGAVAAPFSFLALDAIGSFESMSMASEDCWDFCGVNACTEGSTCRGGCCD